jgi:pyrrolidone-carboxylate peptidase
MKTLLTGSNRFGNKEINPSERVVQHFAEKARKTDDADLVAEVISAAISNHAGTYVCNHVFYLARHEVELLGTNSACGFIHLPPLSERREGAPHVEGLPLEVMIEAVECCLGF